MNQRYHNAVVLPNGGRCFLCSKRVNCVTTELQLVSRERSILMVRYLTSAGELSFVTLHLAGRQDIHKFTRARDD